MVNVQNFSVRHFANPILAQNPAHTQQFCIKTQEPRQALYCIFWPCGNVMQNVTVMYIMYREARSYFLGCLVVYAKRNSCHVR